jgi:signal transduction histidine kinase
MNDLKNSLRRIPWWAFVIVAVAIGINVLYIHYKWQLPTTGSRFISNEKDQLVYSEIPPGSPAAKAGLKVGDIFLTINGYTMREWTDRQRVKARDTLRIRILREGSEMTVYSVPVMRNSEYSWFMILMAVVMSLAAIAGLFVLSRKPRDQTVQLFFLIVISFSICHHAIDLPFPEIAASVTFLAFCICASQIQPLLIHFHLIFPRPSALVIKYPWLPSFFYLLGIIPALFYFGSHLPYVYMSAHKYNLVYTLANKVILYWITITYAIAFSVAIYQYFHIRDTLARNQVRIVVTGTLIALSGPISYTFFYSQLNALEAATFPYLLQLISELGSLFLVICLLIAIFRYRIWNTEIVIRKALLYLTATLVITGSYFILIYIADRLTSRENAFIRGIVIAISVAIFLMLRDRIQQLIDRLFNRETYDSAKVVSDFEEHLSGIYDHELLKEKISLGIDRIFHFKSFLLSLKTSNNLFEVSYAMGMNHHKPEQEFCLSDEALRYLNRSEVFSPGELKEKPQIFEIAQGELIIPMIDNGRSEGFFICGQKKSERIYTLQDIRVLRLLSTRTVALFNTAALYRKELERQVMLERERMRISQDMHDDVGASLTRISILSELAKNRPEVSGETREWLGQISDTSRGVMEEMGQIIWALNLKNDTLDGLVAYLRRFAAEYLEPTPVNCMMELPEAMPSMALSVEVRRNIYLCVREALHNVVKHSGARQVKISLQKGEHQFTISIMDDGTGFDPQNMEFPGNGLVNMRKRMNDIGGEFRILAKVGEGTEIVLVVSLK